MRRGFAPVLAAAALAVAAAPAHAAEGPCSEPGKAAFPAGDGHDHGALEQHRFSCQMEQTAHHALAEELADRPDVMLGEMDVEAGVLAIAVAYPESGFLIYDVSDPTQPVFKSWYRGSECEGAIIDVDCGAYVDLSPDGKTAFLSVQDISVVPGGRPRPGESGIAKPISTPGVEVVDVSDPAAPQLTQVYPVLSVGGVHASRSHVIPEGPDNGPRAPGEYLFSVANSVAIEITRVDRTGGVPKLVPVARVHVGREAHDTFVQEDPLDGRTYMYVAAGFETGFAVYDVTDPTEAVYKGEWDPTPECSSDWYSHTIDVAVRGGRRYVTMPAELFDNGETSEEEQAAGCGAVAGNADKAGPLWIVDATDFSKLGTDEDEPAELKRKSQEALLTTWTNPAGAPGGNLLFSPHNQQIVGDKIYLSAYHAGVWVLDASAAFAGNAEPPAELGFVVPSDSGRPIYEFDVGPQIPFISAFLGPRPAVWDAVFWQGSVLAADEVGGLYSFRYAPSEEPPSADPATEPDTPAPPAPDPAPAEAPPAEVPPAEPGPAAPPGAGPATEPAPAARVLGARTDSRRVRAQLRRCLARARTQRTRARRLAAQRRCRATARRQLRR